jgi:hypothetical protein
MAEQLPIIRYAAVTKITKLACAVCTNTWQMVDFPDHTRPRTLFCPWCKAEQVYLADKPSLFCEKDTDIPMDIINGSSLTTEREREVFAAIVRDFIERELPTAPREKLHDIELVMRGWRPTADHRK